MGNCNCFSNSEKLEAQEITTDRSNIDPKAVYENIIKIQSSFRGYLARKSYYDERLASYNKQVVLNLQKFASTHLKTSLKKLTPYDYSLKSDAEDPLFESRVFKPIYQLPAEQGVYIGEWYYN